MTWTKFQALIGPNHFQLGLAVPASLYQAAEVAALGYNAVTKSNPARYVLTALAPLFLLQRDFYPTILEFAFLCVVRGYRLLGPPPHAGHPIGWHTFVD